MRQRDRMRFAQLDHTKPRATQGWVNAENYPVRIRDAQIRFKHRRGGTRRGATHAILHLFELLKRDAHRGKFVNTTPFSKE